MRIYFAHPIPQYNSQYERLCQEQISKEFPDSEIVNPNDPAYSRGYKLSGSRGMEYWHQLAESCDILVAVPFTQNRKHGSGVYSEMVHMTRLGKPVYELHRGKFRELDYADIRRLRVGQPRKFHLL